MNCAEVTTAYTMKLVEQSHPTGHELKQSFKAITIFKFVQAMYSIDFNFPVQCTSEVEDNGKFSYVP